jgi:hypothetical protein
MQQPNSYGSLWESLNVPEIVQDDKWRFDLQSQQSLSYPSSYDSSFLPPWQIYSQSDNSYENNDNPNYIGTGQDYSINTQELDNVGEEYSVAGSDEEMFFAMSPSLPSPISINASSPRRTSLKPLKSPKLKIYKDGKFFPCDMCSSTFSRNHDLKRHVR